MMRRILPIAALAALAALASAGFSRGADAQSEPATSYPSRTVRIISPFAPGGITDTFSRLVAAKMQETWGQPVVVENRPGAGGNIGADAVAKAPPDGYLLVMGSVGTHAINAFLMKKISFDPVKDFAPVSLVAETDGLLCVNTGLPVRTLADLIKLAQTSPLTAATAGLGTPSHLAAELLRQKIGGNIAIAHYRGAAPSITDLMSGVASLTFGTMQTVLPFVQAGKLKPIAILGAKRSMALPEIPTMEEAGLPGFALTNWVGLFAPAGTPPDIVAKLNAEVRRIMLTSEMQTRLTNEGAKFTPNTPEQFAAFLRAENATWGPIVKASGASIE